MLHMQADKSCWSIEGGDIIMIEDDGNIRQNLLTDYGLLTQANIDGRFSAHKTKGGSQLQNSAQFANCLIKCICPEMSQVVLSEHHLWKSQSITCGEKLFKALMNKAIIDNKQMTRKLQDQYDDCAANMGEFDPNIDKLLLFYRNLTMMLKTRGKVLIPRYKITTLLYEFLMVKDKVF